MTARRDHVGRLSGPLAGRSGRSLQNRRGKPRGDFLSVEHIRSVAILWNVLACPKVEAGSEPVNYP
jgi:hypothetical protein